MTRFGMVAVPMLRVRRIASILSSYEKVSGCPLRSSAWATRRNRPITGHAQERPGLRVFSVSPDRKQAWFTATVLAHSTDRHATWLTRQDQPFIVASTLDVTP